MTRTEAITWHEKLAMKMVPVAVEGDRIAIQVKPTPRGLRAGKEGTVLLQFVARVTRAGLAATITADTLTIAPQQAPPLPVPADGLIAELAAVFPTVPREELLAFAPIFAGFAAKYADFLAISLEPGNGDRPGSLMLTPRNEIGSLMMATAEATVADD